MMAKERKPVRPVAADEKQTPKRRGRKADSGEGGGSEVDALMASARKRMGDHVVLDKGGSSFTCIETGIFTLDLGLLGGFQESRVNIVYGWAGVAKTTICARACAAAQRKYPDGVVVYIDAEGTFDFSWAEAHGVDTDPTRFKCLQPETGEECVDLLEAALRAKEVVAVVLDSIPAIVPAKMIERSAEDPTMAVRASLMGVACSKVIAALNKERGRGHNPTVLMINQWRRKVGFTMGDNRTLPGGDQLNFVASVKAEIKKTPKGVMGEDQHGTEELVASEHAFDIAKLKGVGRTITQGEFRLVCSDSYRMSDADATMPDIVLAAGVIDDYKTVVTYGKRMGFVTGGGTSWAIDGVDAKFKNLQGIVEFLVENPDEFVTLKRKMIALKRQEAGIDAIPKDGYLLGYVGKTTKRRTAT